jgi:hypothetical protein
MPELLLVVYVFLVVEYELEIDVSATLKNPLMLAIQSLIVKMKVFFKLFTIVSLNILKCQLSTYFNEYKCRRK